MAELARGSDRFSEASRFYEQYLQLEPTDPEARKGNAICLYLGSLKDPGEDSFKKADEAIVRILETDWDWEKGHLSRLDMYFHFSKIETLKKEYEEIAAKDQEKKAVCERVLGIARLTSRFHEDPPVIQTNILDRYQEFEGFFKKYWLMMLGIPLLLWIIWGLAQVSRSADENKKMILVFVSFILGLALLMLFFFNMAKLSKKSKQKTEKNDDNPKTN